MNDPRLNYSIMHRLYNLFYERLKYNYIDPYIDDIMKINYINKHL